MIITSDHGEEFFDHGSVGHGHSMFEELLHIPLIIRLPDRHGAVNRYVDAEVGHVDIAPTLCDLLGVECLEPIQGRSMAPLMFDARVHREESVSIAEFPSFRQYALRNARFKAIVQGFETRLYDLFADPRETIDRSAEFPIARAALIDALGDHIGSMERQSKEQEARPDQNEGEAAAVDAETEARLRAMGYLGD